MTNSVLDAYIRQCYNSDLIREFLKKRIADGALPDEQSYITKKWIEFRDNNELLRPEDVEALPEDRKDSIKPLKDLCDAALGEVVIHPSIKTKINLDINYQKIEIETELSNYTTQEYEAAKNQLIDYAGSLATAIKKIVVAQLTDVNVSTKKPEEPKIDLGPSQKQKDLLYRIGYSDEEIAEIKTAKEASNIISRANRK